MKKQITAWILLTALLAALLSGCGDASNAASEQDRDSDLVYRAETLSLGEAEDYEISYIHTFCVSGNQLFFAAACVTGTEAYTDPATGETVMDAETGEPRQADVVETLLFRMDLDTEETVRLEPYQPLEAPEGQQGDSYLTAMTAGADGTVWTVETVYPYAYDLPEDFDAQNDSAQDYYAAGDPMTALRQYDADGRILQSIDLGARIPRQMLMDGDQNIYIVTDDKIILLDSKGTALAELDHDGAALYQLSEAEIGVLEHDAVTGGASLRLIDPLAGNWGESVDLVSGISQIYAGFADYQYLYEDFGDAVYGFRQEDGRQKKLFSWAETGIGGSAVEYLLAFNDGRIFALVWDSLQHASELVCLNRVEASSLPQTQELTLAGMYFSTSLLRAVANYNSSQDDVQIVTKDYYELMDGNYEAALTKLNTELLSGNMPDILCMNSLMPADQYGSAGLLTDLWPLIDSDRELSRDDLMTHLFDVLSTGEHLYQVTGSFSIETAVGNADLLGDRTSWTLDELLKARDEINPSASILGRNNDTKGSILSLFGNLGNMRNFVDWEAKTCSFDSPAFIEILNFANSFPAEVNADADDETIASTSSRFINGEQLLMGAVINSFVSYQFYEAMVGGNPCFIGYPSANGTGHIFEISEGLSITSACRNVDQAWSFVRTVLTEDYEPGGFPTNRHAFEALVEEMMTPQYKIDPTTGEALINPETGEKAEYNSTTNYNGQTLEIHAMTQEEYDQFMQLYEACNGLFSYDSAIEDIVFEEAAPFFDGQKTAEETVKIIQDRVGLYLAEQE